VRLLCALQSKRQTTLLVAFTTREWPIKLPRVLECWNWPMDKSAQIE
jgi:hypothetical protein